MHCDEANDHLRWSCYWIRPSRRCLGEPLKSLPNLHCSSATIDFNEPFPSVSADSFEL